MKPPNIKALINPEKLTNVSDVDFGIKALEVFRHQYRCNDIYRRYCDAIHLDVNRVDSLSQIPFLPVSFFKTHCPLTAPASRDNAVLLFESSGTTGTDTSRHYVADAAIYERSLLSGFAQYYGDAGDYTILALLPSYLERKNASLVYMAKTLMKAGGHSESGFYIDEWERMRDVLVFLERSRRKVLLLGVTFALLDFAEAFPMRLESAIVMETGGMKGRKKEMTREEVHGLLRNRLGVQSVHSEYGMTELLSQAYATSAGIFQPTGTMKVLVRDMNDPFDVKTEGSGVLNVIDLANIHSCSFIATEDLGKLNADGSFEVLGRVDNSALRGCSQMTA